MQRNRWALAVAVLVVVAIALATATLANPVTNGSGGHSASGGGSGLQNGDGQGGSGNLSDGSTHPGGSRFTLDIGLCIPFLTTTTFYLLALVVAIALAVFIRWRTSTIAALAILITFSVPSLFIHALLTKCGNTPTPKPGSFSPQDIANKTFPISGDQAGGAANTVTQPPVILVILFLGLAVLFLLFVRSTGNDSATEDPEVAEPEESLGDVGAAAGAAADRIEGNVNVENAVFSAWRDMVTSLDVASPRTATPAEFADAARDAGMDSEHVETLTGLFREVRYGGEPVTEERERRALSALREIEAAYATEDES